MCTTYLWSKEWSGSVGTSGKEHTTRGEIRRLYPDERSGGVEPVPDDKAGKVATRLTSSSPLQDFGRPPSRTGRDRRGKYRHRDGGRPTGKVFPRRSRRKPGTDFGTRSVRPVGDRDSRPVLGSEEEYGPRSGDPPRPRTVSTPHLCVWGRVGAHGTRPIGEWSRPYTLYDQRPGLGVKGEHFLLQNPDTSRVPLETRHTGKRGLGRSESAPTVALPARGGSVAVTSGPRPFPDPKTRRFRTSLPRHPLPQSSRARVRVSQRLGPVRRHGSGSFLHQRRRGVTLK